MNYLASKDLLMYVNLGTIGTPDWKIVGCTTSKGVSMTQDSVAVTTDCNGGWVSNQPGDKSWNFSNSTYIPKDADANYATDDELFELFKNDSKDADGLLAQWKIESLDAQFDYLRIGRGFINDLSESSDSGDYLTRDITVTGSDELDNTVTT